MAWALPTCKPAFWGLLRLEDGRQVTRAAVSVAPLTGERGDRNPVGKQRQEGGRYRSSSSRFARVEEIVRLVQDSEDVEAALQGWNRPLSAKSIVAILNTLGRWDKVLKFFEWVEARDGQYEINNFTYNVLLKSLRNGRQLERCEQVVEEMISRGIQPDNYTYSTMINCAKRCRQPEEALKWFERMKAAGIAPDEVTYNTMIDIYGRLGRVNEAVELYEKLRFLDWNLDTVTYGVLMNVFAKTGDYRAVLQLFQEMKDKGISQNAVTMNTLIGTLSKAGKVNQAKQVFKEMKMYGVEPTPVTLSILIEMLVKVGAYEEAFETYETVRTEGWKCDIVLYNSLLRACVEGGLVKRAEDLLQEMKRMNCKPDHWTFRTAMSTYATIGEVDKAREMFRKVVQLFGNPDTPLYTILIRAYKQAGKLKQVEEVFKQMISDGCRPDERMTGLLLSCICLCEGDEEIQSVLRCIAFADPALHEVVASLRAKDDSQDCLQKVEEVILQCPSPRPLCNLLIDICCSSGMKEVARKVFLIGISAGAYEGLQIILPSAWRLNLRTLSSAAAQCAIEGWFSLLTNRVKEGKELPEDLIIETGIGRLKSGHRLHLAVGNLLESIGAPFTMSTEPAGYYVATKVSVEAWIKNKLTKSGASKQLVTALPLAEI